ncbi:MAG: thioredoxin fold domain-containing protein, partial [Bacteroidota bacterium]
MKISVYTLILILLVFIQCATPNEVVSQKDIHLKKYTFPEVEELLQIDKRKIAVFIHTSWCKFCHSMKQTTLKSKSVIEKLNKEFYFIDFNAEEKESISYGGRTFHFKASGSNSGVHELAETIGSIDGELTFPAFVILDQDNQIIFQHNVFLSESEMEAV